MKLKKLKYSLVGILAFIGACDFNPDHIELPEWQGEVMGPLVNTRVEARKLIGANTFKLQHTFTMEDLGYENGVRQEIDAIESELGPFELQVSEVFERLNIQNGPLKIRLTNLLPVDLLKGTVFVLRDQVNGKVLFEYELKRLIPSGEEGYEIEIPARFLEEIRGQSVYLSVEPLLTDSSDGLVLVSQDHQLKVGFNLGDLDYSFAVARESESLTFSAKADFRMKGKKVESQPVKGTFRLFVENRMPIEWEIQAYFWNKDRTVLIDSLFENRAVIKKAQTDSALESDFAVAVNSEKVRRINNAEIVTINFQMSVTNESNTVTIQKSDYLASQLVGKFQVDVENL